VSLFHAFYPIGLDTSQMEAMKTWDKQTMVRKTLIQTLKLRVFNYHSPTQAEFRFNPSKNYRNSEAFSAVFSYSAVISLVYDAAGHWNSTEHNLLNAEVKPKRKSLLEIRRTT
jgi:hypothetical protein